MNLTLLLAPIPALIGSVLLMRSAQVSSSLWVQQIAIAAICFTACAIAMRWRSAMSSRQTHTWLAAISVIAAIAAIAPLFFGSSSGPQRWISLGGFRLYAASCVLPAALLCLSMAPPRQHRVQMILVAVIASALALQPDAAQVTAFSIAAAIALVRVPHAAPYKALAIVALIAWCAWAWTKPDPLEPISYVEGVLTLAAQAGWIALAAAIVSMAIPVLSLVWLGIRNGQHALFTVAAYYVCIIGFAATQITPMPLLGFGAGPIIGYFLMVFVYMRLRDTHASRV